MLWLRQHDSTIHCELTSTLYLLNWNPFIHQVFWCYHSVIFVEHWRWSRYSHHYCIIVWILMELCDKNSLKSLLVFQWIIFLQHQLFSITYKLKVSTYKYHGTIQASIQYIPSYVKIISIANIAFEMDAFQCWHWTNESESGLKLSDLMSVQFFCLILVG